MKVGRHSSRQEECWGGRKVNEWCILSKHSRARALCVGVCIPVRQKTWIKTKWEEEGQRIHNRRTKREESRVAWMFSFLQQNAAKKRRYVDKRCLTEASVPSPRSHISIALVHPEQIKQDGKSKKKKMNECKTRSMLYRTDSTSDTNQRTFPNIKRDISKMITIKTHNKMLLTRVHLLVEPSCLTENFYPNSF